MAPSRFREDKSVPYSILRCLMETTERATVYVLSFGEMNTETCMTKVEARSEPSCVSIVVGLIFQTSPLRWGCASG